MHCPSLHEGRQREGVPRILDPEDAHEEAVSAEEDTTPDENSYLLSPGIGHSRNLDGKGDGAEGHHTVYGLSVVSR